MVKVRTRGRDAAAGSAGEPSGSPEGPSSAAGDESQGLGIGDSIEGFGDDSAAVPEGFVPDEEASEEGVASLGVSGQEGIEDEAPAPAPARRGGRPKGTGKAKKLSGGSFYAKKRRDEAARSAAATFTDVPVAIDHGLMVRILLQMIEGMTVPQLGEHARFQPDERKLIEPSLESIMKRMTPEAAQHFSRFADPLMLGVGLLVWGTRVFSTPRQAPGPSRPRPTPIRPEAYQPPVPSAAPADSGSDVGVPDADLLDAWAPTGATI